jgi:hypothetical protein
MGIEVEFYRLCAEPDNLGGATADRTVRLPPLEDGRAAMSMVSIAVEVIGGDLPSPLLRGGRS